MEFDFSRLKKNENPNDVSEVFKALDTTSTETEGNPLDLNGFAPKNTIIPEGYHPVMITGIEAKLSKKGVKYYLMTYTVVAGEFKGITFDEGLFLFHTSAKTSESAKIKLVKYMNAAGVPATSRKFSSEKDLLKTLTENLPVKALVGVKEDDGFGEKNTIKDVFELTQEFITAYDSAATIEKKDDVGDLLSDLGL